MSSMRFNDTQLQAALVQWRGISDVLGRSEADNLWFEQRISAARQAAFEVEAAGANNEAALRKAHIDYHKEFVVVDVGDIPHTFDLALAPADLGAIDEVQKIVRIESLERPLGKLGMTFDEYEGRLTMTKLPSSTISCGLGTPRTSATAALPSPRSKMKSRMIWRGLTGRIDCATGSA
jgi:hypothetical protein